VGGGCGGGGGKEGGGRGGGGGGGGGKGGTIVLAACVMPRERPRLAKTILDRKSLTWSPVNEGSLLLISPSKDMGLRRSVGTAFLISNSAAKNSKKGKKKELHLFSRDKKGLHLFSRDKKGLPSVQPRKKEVAKLPLQKGCVCVACPIFAMRLFR